MPLCIGAPAFIYRPNSSPLLTGLQHFWSLDQATGGEPDLVGAKTLSQGATVGYSAGGGPGGKPCRTFPGNARLFNSSVTVPAQSAISIWIYPDVSADVAFAHGDPYPGIYSLIQKFATGYVYIEGNPYNPMNSYLADLAWHHCVWNRKPSGGTDFYIDGVIRQTDPAAASHTAQLEIGSYQGGQNWFGNASLCSVYSRTLTAPEIAQLYNSGNGLAYNAL